MVTRVIREVPFTRPRNLRSSANTCLNFSFLSSKRGILKIIQVFVGGMCETLVIRYGSGVSLLVGNAYTSFLTNVSACLLTTGLLLFSYFVSENTRRAISKSIFEIVFNVTAAWLYLGASAYLMLITSVILWPLYLITPFFQAYPALMAASSFGFFLASMHALDAYHAVKCYRGL